MNRNFLGRSALGAFVALAWTSCAAGESALVAPHAEVGIVAGETLRYADVPPALESDLQELERRYHRQLHQLELTYRRAQQATIERRAKDFLDSRVMRREADEQHVTVADLIRGVRNPEVTDDDVRRYYEQHRQQMNRPFAEMLLPINEYLVNQAAAEGKRQYLAGLYAKFGARFTLAPLRETVADTGPVRGPAAARVTIVEFADFQCPYCGALEPVLRQVLERYPRDVRLVFRQLPLADIHPNALGAASASLCAAEQGRFWELHDALLANQAALDADSIRKTASGLHIDLDRFGRCLESAAPREAIDADIEAATLHGVAGTPAIFINGRFVDGSVDFQHIADVVDDELARQRQDALPAVALRR